ncbi:hypothetical protein CspHIS471_0502600 [Cutaneotrichosporon sp. HIS471]|nr:hypothetical protein CspHIS471_0502600 [Cutaneotrichosporon sp. HIS471]
MTRPLNGNRSTESTTRIAATSNHTLRHPQGRPPPVRSTSEGWLDMGYGGHQIANPVNRRSGDFSVSGNGFGHQYDIEHRATWAASEHTWQQGYHVARATEQLTHGRADLRANRPREAQWQGGIPSANGGTHSLTNGPRTPADAPLTNESSFRANESASIRHAPSSKPLPLPFNHGVLFTVEGFMNDTEEVLDDAVLATSATVNRRHEYQLPALGSFGDFLIQNHLFSVPNADDTPNDSPTDSSSPTPTASTFAESHQRTITDELRKLDPAAQRHVAQAVVNANAHTKDMLAGTNELLGLLAKLRKDSSAPRFMSAYQQRPLPGATHINAISRPSSIHSAGTSLSRSASVRTIRSMIQQTTSSRRATMLSTVTAPNSDESDEGGTITDGTATETDDSHTTGTESIPSSPEQRAGVRYSEERALGSLLQLIEERGVMQPQIEALRRHMPGPLAVSRQPSSIRRSFPHRANTKVRRSKKKRRSRKDKEREQGLPRLPSVSGSESEGLDFDVWEDVGKGDPNFMADIMDVAQWYNLQDVVDEGV